MAGDSPARALRLDSMSLNEKLKGPIFVQRMRCHHPPMITCEPRGVVSIGLVGKIGPGVHGRISPLPGQAGAPQVRPTITYDVIADTGAIPAPGTIIGSDDPGASPGTAP